VSENGLTFELHVTERGETSCIALLGEFDVVGVEQLEAELRRAEKEEDRPTLDLRGLGFIGSTGSVPARY
jgi:anti-anti-sigma regulatory factor